MAADGSGPQTKLSQIEWSSDPVVRRYQSFAYDHKPGEKRIFVDETYLTLPWTKEAGRDIAKARKMSRGARQEHHLRTEGEPRAGKTAFIRSQIRANMPVRNKDGLYIPVAYCQMPSVPEPATITTAILYGIGDPTWAHKRSRANRVIYTAEALQRAGVEVLGVDDFHRLVDTRGQKVQHVAADYLIELAFYFGGTLIFSGLSRMQTVFDTNEQLAGRTQSPICFRRLDWRKDRALFIQLVENLLGEFERHGISTKAISRDFFFRLYCGTGGLIGYVVRVLRAAALICDARRVPLEPEVVRKAVREVVTKNWPGGIDPFHENFPKIESPETLALANSIGTGLGPGNEESK